MPAPRLTGGSANRRLPRAAVSHPRPRQRQPRRGVGSQTSRGEEPPLSSDEPSGAASASRVRARREPLLCRLGSVRHPFGGGWRRQGGGREREGGRAPRRPGRKGKRGTGKVRRGHGHKKGKRGVGEGGAAPRAARPRGGGCGGPGRGEGLVGPGPPLRGGRKGGREPLRAGQGGDRSRQRGCSAVRIANTPPPALPC